MVLGYILLPGLVAAFVLAFYGIRTGKKHPTWLTRLASPIGFACAAAAFLFVPSEMNMLYDRYPVLNNLLAVAGICGMSFFGSLFVTACLGSKNPAYDALLPENQNKPSVKRATAMLALTGLILGIPGLMLSIIFYNGEFMWGHLFIIAFPAVFASLTLHSAMVELKGTGGTARPPKWSVAALFVLVAVLIIAVFKGPGLLFLIFLPVVLALSGRRA